MKSNSDIALLAAVFLGSTFALADSSVPKSCPLSKMRRVRRKAWRARQTPEVTFEDTDVCFYCKSRVKEFNNDHKKFVKMLTDTASKK